MSPRDPSAPARDRGVPGLRISSLLAVVAFLLAGCDRVELQDPTDTTSVANTASAANTASVATPESTGFRELVAEAVPPVIDGWVFHDHHLGPFRERVSVAVSPSFRADEGSARRAVAVIVEGGPPPSVRTRFGAIVEVDGAEPLRFREPAIQVEPISNTWAGAMTDRDISVRFLP